MKKLIPLFLILLLAAFLRFWHLGESPPGVLVDEASIGYNAYSIMKTGQDEWGQRNPLTIRAFGDFKPPGYIYAAIPFIKIFGLSPFSVRLPSAIFGVVSVLCLYLIVLLVMRNNGLALLSALFFAISPWHVNTSRMAWEANMALGSFLLGLTLFLWGIKKGYLFFFLSAFFFSFSIYVYLGYRILTPVLLIFIILFFFKKGFLKTKSLLIFLAVIILLNLPFLPMIVSKETNSRFSQINISSEQGTVLFINEQRNFCGFTKNNLILRACYLIWNKPTVISVIFLKDFLAAMSPDFLFLNGDTFKFITNPNHGGMYLWFFPLFFVGLAKIIREIRQSHYQFVLLWFVLSPTLSATAGPPNFIRSNMVLIPVTIICALGVYYIFEILKTLPDRGKLLSKLFLTGIIFLAGISTLAMAIDYFLVYTKKTMVWDEYYPQVYAFLKNVDRDYQTIYFHKLNSQPYIYMLFYEAIEPNFFREVVKRDNYDVMSVGKYQFVDFGFSGAFCRWQEENKVKTLLVTDEDNLWPKSIAPRPLLTVKSANGVHVLAVVYDIGKTVDYLKEKEIDLSLCSPSQKVP